MPDRKAKDIMIPMAEFVTVKTTDSLKEAISVLKNSLSQGHRTLGVLNHNGALVGFLTNRTILKAMSVYGFNADGDTSSTSMWGKFFAGREKNKLKNIQVQEIMRRSIDISVNEESPLQEVTQVLLKNQINHIAVTDQNDTIVGIIRTVDILDVLIGFLED